MTNTSRWGGGLAVGVVTTCLMLTGIGVAAADGDPTVPPSQSVVCTKRIPAALARIDRLTDRINGDAGTRGSTAWLKAKSEQARQAGLVALADLLDTRVEARPGRLDELAQLKRDVQDVQATDCAS